MRPTMFAAMNSLTNALVTEDTAAWLGFLDAQDKVRPGADRLHRLLYERAVRDYGRGAVSQSLRRFGVALRGRHCHRGRGLATSAYRSDQRRDVFRLAETDEHVPANVIPTLKSALDKAGTRY